LQNNESRLIEKTETSVAPIDQQKITAVTKQPKATVRITGSESIGNNIV
jgi:hypothetical protein